MIDEDPSPEDLERFGDDTGHCPECGAEIWDQAEVCPKCRHAIDGTLSHTPTEEGLKRRLLVVVALAALAAFVAMAM